MPSSPDLTPETPWDAAARLGKLDDGTVPEFCREAYWIHYYRDRFQADLNRSIPKREAVA